MPAELARVRSGEEDAELGLAEGAGLAGLHLSLDVRRQREGLQLGPDQDGPDVGHLFVRQVQRLLGRRQSGRRNFRNRIDGRADVTWRLEIS